MKHDDVCVCGHTKEQHCFCGMHCMHIGPPVPAELFLLFARVVGALFSKGAPGGQRRIEHGAEGYRLYCKCTGFKIAGTP